MILATAMAVVAFPARMAPATDLPPALVGEFTRQVQPLLLNKCAAGACHGGAAAPAPRLIRAGVAGQFDRATTLANMATLDEAIRRSGSHRGFMETISGRHPAEPGSSRLSLAPLTPPERAVLERWLIASAERRGPPRLLPQAEPDSLAIDKEKPPTSERRPADRNAPPRKSASGLKPVTGTETDEPGTKSPQPSPRNPPQNSTSSPRRADAAPQRPNRFRALIDSAANPLPLPPPEAPRGVLLGPAAE